MPKSLQVTLRLLVDVAWGMFNFAVGYILIFGVGDFAFGLTIDILMVGLGAIVTAVGLAWYSGHIKIKWE